MIQSETPEREASYQQGRSDARAGRGLYYSGRYCEDYLAGARSVRNEKEADNDHERA